MRQVVFDLETWGLDRGWGVTLVASFLEHGSPAGSQQSTLTIRDFSKWHKGVRSNDRELAEAIFAVLSRNHIAYAHNGEYFDVRWLRTVALKYGLAMPRLKLIDPAAIARQKYLLGRNSLEALGDFLQAPGSKSGALEKMHISPDIWRAALLDNDDMAWKLLVQRCESDVVMLNAIASRVTGDVGMIDEKGSAWR
ncbi:MAG: ribonuclease H-like domain-containing protein [Terriglobia bacterium]